MDPRNIDTKKIVEKIEVAGGDLLDKARELLGDASASKVVIRNKDGSELFTLPLALGLAGGGLLTFITPRLAAIGAIGALVTQVNLEIVREVDEKTAQAAIDAGEAEEYVEEETA